MNKVLYCLLLLPCAVHAAPPSYAGRYAGGGMEYTEELLLTDNGRFCYAFSAGAMDLFGKGSWRAATEGKDTFLQLRNDAPPPAPFALAVSSAAPDRDGGEPSPQRLLRINTQALAYATGLNLPVAFGSSPNPPDRFKLLYAQENPVGMNRTDTLPIPEDARYLFIGSPRHRMLYRFNIGSSRTVMLNAYAAYQEQPADGEQPEIKLRWNNSVLEDPASSRGLYVLSQPWSQLADAEQADEIRRLCAEPDALPTRPQPGQHTTALAPEQQSALSGNRRLYAEPDDAWVQQPAGTDNAPKIRAHP